MNVIGYVRVSTEEQAQSGLSIEAQWERIQKYCELYGHHLDGRYLDEGVSAKNRKRKGLKEAIAYLTKGVRTPDGRVRKGQGLVVTKLDRLTRSVGDLTYFLEKVFTPGGPALCVVDEFIQTQTAAGRMVAYMMTTFSQYERELAGERTKVALDVKKERGERAGECPYGYEADADGKLLPHQREQEVLEYIYDARHPKQRFATSLPFDQIADLLNQLGYRTRASGRVKNGKMQQGRFKKGTVHRLYQVALERFGNQDDSDVSA